MINNLGQDAATFFRGTIRHRRFTPVTHEFTYQTSMLMLDLDCLEQHIRPWPLASAKHPAIARFRREDYVGEGDLKQYILSQVEQKLAKSLQGKVLLLTNLRYFGALMNPIAMFYCYDLNGQLGALVLQVTNTPWQEQICYVLDVDVAQKNQHAQFAKAMHVSPFNPMQMQYDCRFNVPQDSVFVHLENHLQGEKHMDATLKLEVVECFSRTKLAYFYATRFPESMKTWWRIHKNALKLMIKRAPIYDHSAPQKSQVSNSSE